MQALEIAFNIILPMMIGSFLLLYGKAYFKFIIRFFGFVFGALLGLLLAILVSIGSEGGSIMSIILPLGIGIFFAKIAWPIHKIIVYIFTGLIVGGIGVILPLALMRTPPQDLLILTFFIFGIIGGYLAYKFYEIIVVVTMAIEGFRWIFGVYLFFVSNISITRIFSSRPGSYFQRLFESYANKLWIILSIAPFFVLLALWIQNDKLLSIDENKRNFFKKLSKLIILFSLVCLFISNNFLYRYVGVYFFNPLFFEWLNFLIWPVSLVIFYWISRKNIIEKRFSNLVLNFVIAHFLSIILFLLPYFKEDLNYYLNYNYSNIKFGDISYSMSMLVVLILYLLFIPYTVQKFFKKIDQHITISDIISNSKTYFHNAKINSKAFILKNKQGLLVLFSCVVIFVMGLISWKSFIKPYWTERTEWKESCERNTLQGYKYYARLYPKGRYMDKANEKIDHINWDIACELNTEDSYNKYLNSKVKGGFIQSAFDSIGKIRERKQIKENAIREEIANMQKQVDEKILNEVFIGKYEFKDDRDGKNYKWAKIGTQIWMAENLAYVPSDNNFIHPQQIKESNSWSKVKAPAYCFYNDDISNYSSYGVLYNWYAVESGKLCPEGWHVPSQNEWDILVQYLTTLEIPNEQSIWINGKVGFMAKYSGKRESFGFNNIDNVGYWWTSTKNSVLFVSSYKFDSESKQMVLDEVGKSMGYAVRCIMNKKVDEITSNIDSPKIIMGVYQMASNRLLTTDDLMDLSTKELRIMRNEIFARHGYVFKTIEMKQYFEAQEWYQSIPKLVDNKIVNTLLTDVEKKNIGLIQKYEKL